MLEKGSVNVSTATDAYAAVAHQNSEASFPWWPLTMYMLSNNSEQQLVTGQGGWIPSRSAGVLDHEWRKGPQRW